MAATEKAIKLAGPLELKVSVVDYSGQGAKDPDELININPSLWQQALDNYQPAVNWVRDYYVKTIGIDSVDSKKVVADKTLEVIRYLTNPVEREGYIRELAKITGVSAKSLVDRLRTIVEREDGETRRIKRQPKVEKVDVNQIQHQQRFLYLDNILAYLGCNPNLRAKYLPKLQNKRLSPVDLELKKWLLDANVWGDELVDQLSSAIESNSERSELLSGVREKIIQLQMLNERVATSVEGIKSEADLLDYLCHYEYDYYMDQSKELMTKALNNESSNDNGQLANKAREARKLAESLDPGWNRRNSYQGLYNLWQSR